MYIIKQSVQILMKFEIKFKSVILISTVIIIIFVRHFYVLNLIYYLYNFMQIKNDYFLLPIYYQFTTN
jgi:hypothetical protein